MVSQPPSPASVGNLDKPLNGSRSNSLHSYNEHITGVKQDNTLSDVEKTACSTESDIIEVSFSGDDDPMCPRSMPLLRKWAIVIIICMGSLCMTCTSSIYTTTYAQMAPEFHTTQFISTIGLSSYVLGIASGPILTSPLSEHYGRRPIYLLSWTLFIIWTIPSAVGRNIETLIISRFFNGFAGTTFLSVAGGTAGDIFARGELQAPMAMVSSAPFVGPSLGPVIGGFINYHVHWRWTYYVMIIWAVGIWVGIVVAAPETYHPVRLREKARWMREQTGDERYRAPMEMVAHKGRRGVAMSLLRPFQLLFLEPMVLCLDIYSAVLLGILYLFFGAFPLIFRTNYGMSLWQVGLTFLGIIAGMLVASASSPLWSRVRERLLLKSESEPEYRLPPAILGGVMIPVGLFWFAWTTYESIHWIVPILGSAVYGCGMLLVFTGIFTFLVDAYPQYAASAMASNSFARAALAAAFPLFGIQMYEALGYQWASSLLAFLTLAMMPFPWLFFKYGKVLRQKSRFAVNS
ncbi:hypothetical protein FE257_004228 [Aspergillus nanangensis]|uniref:Major facilitator superfamily (MFS) profile domain-containing protein n=1 Tax=Aspergillus nanangensis TaxID=2582783 RepID=A0AAD4GW03_ASPNN|nr:hypothetical protein FE257_004228 [Aspergillus nanangensis]